MTRKFLLGSLLVIGVLLLAVLALYWQASAGSVRAEPLVGAVTDEQRLVPFEGSSLAGARLYAYTTSDAIPQGAMVRLHPAPGNLLKEKINPRQTPVAAQTLRDQLDNPQQVTADLAQIWDQLRDGDRLHFRLVKRSILARLFPKFYTYDCQTEVGVSGALLPTLLPADPSMVDAPYPHLFQIFKPTFKIGEIVRLPGQQYGASKGQFKIDGKPSPTIHWSDTEIIFRIPEKTRIGENIIFEIDRSTDAKQMKFLAGVQPAGSIIQVDADTPTLDKIALGILQPGQSARITGDHLGAPGNLTVNRTRADISFWSDRAVAFTVPGAASSGMQHFTIMRKDGKSVSFYASIKRAAGTAAPKPTSPIPSAAEDAVSLLMGGYEKLRVNNRNDAEPLFAKAVAMSDKNSVEGQAIQAIVSILLDPQIDGNYEGARLADRAMRAAKTDRERGLAFIAKGFYEDKSNWEDAARAGDDKVKAFADELMNDKR